MEWTNAHDILLVREIMVLEPYQHKPGSRESGGAWEKIAENLRKIDSPRFLVTQRSVRDRFKLLISRFKVSQRKELAASGINPKPSELESGLEAILDKMTSYNENREKETEEKEKAMKDKKSAEDMRKKAMETLGQTKKRKSEGCEKEKKARRGGNDTVEFLREKAEFDRENKKEELRLRALELEERKQSQDTISQQQMQQQAQFQQTLGLLTQQQQQMLHLITKFVKK